MSETDPRPATGDEAVAGPLVERCEFCSCACVYMAATATARAERAERERDEARSALARYGRHAALCGFTAVPDRLGGCTCGFTDVLGKLAARREASDGG